MRFLKSSLILLLVLYSNLLICQTYSTLTSDTEIYKIVKHLHLKNLKKGILKWDRCDIFKELDCISTTLIMKNGDSIISDDLLNDFQKHYNAINTDSSIVFSFIKDKRNRKYNEWVSVPLISSDGKIGLIKYQESSCLDCSIGGIYILRKSKNKWKVIDFRCTWMS